MNVATWVQFAWGFLVTIIGLLIYAAISLTRISTIVKSNQTVTKLLYDSLDKRVSSLEEIIKEWIKEKGSGR